MGFTDLRGNPITPDDAAVALGIRKKSGVSPARIPTGSVPPVPSIPEKAGNAFTRNIGPILGQAGGAEAGALAGAALAPETGGASLALPIIGATLGAGAGNVATSKGLPERLGGDPNQSATSAFLWGALPELFLGAPGRVLSESLASTAREAPRLAEEERIATLGKESKPTRERVGEAIQGRGETPQSAQQLAGALGRQNLQPRPPMSLAEGGGLATNELRDAVTQPIAKLREQYGQPIGNAYRSLKGEVPIDATGFSDKAKTLSDQLIAPTSPQARGLLNRFKMFDPAAQKEAFDAAHGFEPAGRPVDTAESIRASEGEPGPQPGAQPSFTESAKAKRELSENLFRTRGGDIVQSGGEFKPKPTKLDDLRNLRQQVNTSLRSAKGGDRYLLGSLQDQIDQQLVEHLPDNMSSLRENYKNLMRRFPYSDLNKLDRMGTIPEVADYAFGGTPENAKDIATAADPKQKAVLQDAFADHILADVDPNLPADAQVKAARAKLAPFLKNGTAKVLGFNDADLKQIVYAPIQRKYFAQKLAQPYAQRAWDKGWNDYLSKAGRNADLTKATEAGFQAWVSELPPEEQALFKRVGPSALPPQSVQVPQLPAPQKIGQQAVEQRLLDSAQQGTLSRRAMFRLPYVLPMGAASAMMGRAGGAGYAMASGAAIGAMLATDAGWRAAMKMGGAKYLGKLFAAKGGAEAAKIGADMFAAIGSRGAQNLSGTHDQEEDVLGVAQ